MAYNRNLRLPACKRLFLRQLAIQIGLPYPTLHREIQIGCVAQPILHKGREYWEYSEHIAQDHIRAGAQNKGRGMRFTNLMPKRRRKRSGPPRRALPKPGHLSIEDGPDISDRSVFGHWEMDTIVSGVHGKGGLLVLVERQTRFYLIVKMRRINQLEVLCALSSLIRSGQMKTVLSIATDNGSGFLDSRRIETLFSKLNLLHEKEAVIWHKRNQPWTSSGVTASNARAMAADNSCCVRAAQPRGRALILLRIFSIGLQSGLKGGSNFAVSPRASISAEQGEAMAAGLWR